MQCVEIFASHGYLEDILFGWGGGRRGRRERVLDPMSSSVATPTKGIPKVEKGDERDQGRSRDIKRDHEGRLRAHAERFDTARSREAGVGGIPYSDGGGDMDEEDRDIGEEGEDAQISAC